MSLPAKTPLTPAQKLAKLLKSADFTHTLLREIDGTDTELEIAVFGEYEEADPEVGASAGYTVHSAVLVSDGSDVALTQSERDDLTMAGDEGYTAKAESARESAADCMGDR